MLLSNYAGFEHEHSIISDYSLKTNLNMENRSWEGYWVSDCGYFTYP